MAQTLGVVITIAVFVVLPSCSSTPDYSPSAKYHSTRFPQTRTVSEAKVWLYWSDSQRIAFVRGFVIGYREGNGAGCRMATDAAAAQSACKERMEQLPGPFSTLVFDDKVSGYSKAMTAFYARYPEDDDVPITFLLEWLALDQKTLGASTLPAHAQKSLRIVDVNWRSHQLAPSVRLGISVNQPETLQRHGRFRRRSTRSGTVSHQQAGSARRYSGAHHHGSRTHRLVVSRTAGTHPG
jgi:hypothetical protein